MDRTPLPAGQEKTGVTTDSADDAPDPMTASPPRMPDYIVSGVDERGRRRAEHLRAPTAADAIETLTAQGLINVRLLTDDTFVNSHGCGDPDESEGLIKPQELARLGKAGKYRARLIIMWAIYRKLWVFPLFGVTLVALQGAASGRPSLIDLVALLFAAFPGLLVILIAPKGPNLLDRLLRAAVAADWDHVLQLVPDLRKAMEPAEDAELETELWRARALAATGRLDEGLEVADQLRDLPLLPPPLADRRIAEIHSAAEDHSEALALLERSAAANPDDAAAWLAIAEILAIRFEEPRPAADAFARATEIPLSDLTEKNIGYIQGAIALCDNRPADARDHLQMACAALHRIPNPMARAIELQALALLSIAEARLGDHRSAMRRFRKAEPFLEAHDDQQLLKRCRAALNLHTAAHF